MESFVNFIWKKWEAFVGYAENTPISFWKYLITFSAIVFLRNVLEVISQKLSNFPGPEHIGFFLHTFAFYVLGFLGVTLILRTFTGERIEKVSKFILFVSFLVLLPPIIDLIATGGAGGVMAYRDLPIVKNAGDLPGAIWNFFLYSPYGMLFSGSNFHPLAQLDRNYGIRLEVLLELILFVWYLALKTKNWLKTLAGFLSIHLGLFFLSCFPGILAAVFNFPIWKLIGKLSALNSGLASANLYIFAAFLPLVAGGLVLWSYFYDRKKFLAVLKNIRPTRVIANLSVLAAGVFLGLRARSFGFGLLPLDGLVIASAFFSIFFYWLGAVSYNDIKDEEGDKIALPERPLPAGVLKKEEMFRLACVSWGLSFAFAFVAGPLFFALILARWCLAYIYSTPPLRLKRLPIISNAILGLVYLLTIFAGYAVFENDLSRFPFRVAAIIFLWFTFATEFKDIKDYEGDKKDGISTLPVVYGLEKGEKVIGFMGAYAFLLVPIIINRYFWILIGPAAVAGTAYYLAVNRKKYRERDIFLISFGFFAIIAFLWFYGIINI